MLGRLYGKWGITDHSNFDRLKPANYPILSDLYELIEEEFMTYDEAKRLLQEILLGLHSLCKGAESKFFNGHTNITNGEFVTFGIKGVLNASKNLRNALLFNVHPYPYHIDASPFDANTLRNITNIMAAKEDLIYKAM